MPKSKSCLQAQASTHTVELKQFQNSPEFDSLCEYSTDYLSAQSKSNGSIEIKNLVGNGIQITLFPTNCGGILYVQANLQKLIDEAYCADDIIDPTDDNLERAKGLIEKHLKSIGFPHKVREYDDEQVHLCVNIEHPGNNSFAREYMRVRRKGPIPFGGTWVPFYDPRKTEAENAECQKDYLRFKFCWGALVLYDKKKQAVREGLVGAEKVPKGAVRYELQLNKTGLQKYKRTTGLHGWALVCWLSQRSKDILFEKLSELYCGGVYLKEHALLKAIKISDFNKPVKKQMEKYVRLTKKKGEVEAARITMKKRGWNRSEFIRFRRRFEEINIQPVPLRKNYAESWLDTPEGCLPRLLNLESSYDDDGFYKLRRRLFHYDEIY